MYMYTRIDNITLPADESNGCIQSYPNTHWDKTTPPNIENRCLNNDDGSILIS